MKFRYLGTAAAEGVPCAFCRCAVCENARRFGGREIRTRSQALIDDTLLIDLCPDTYLHAIRDNIHLEKIRYLLITHSHEDHLYSPELRNRKTTYAYMDEEDEKHPLAVYAADRGYKIVSDLIQEHSMENRVTVNLLKPFEAFTVGEYRVLPLPANHTQKTSPLLYIIEKGEASVFYAHDTGDFSKDTWEALRAYGKPLSLFSLDCTCTRDDACRDHHLGLVPALEIMDKMQKIGLVDEKTVRVLHHFSHNGGYSYKDLQEKVLPMGILVSYDGMELTL